MHHLKLIAPCVRLYNVEATAARVHCGNSQTVERLWGTLTRKSPIRPRRTSLLREVHHRPRDVGEESARREELAHLPVDQAPLAPCFLGLPCRYRFGCAEVTLVAPLNLRYQRLCAAKRLQLLDHTGPNQPLA